MSYNTADNVAAAIEFFIKNNKSGILHLSSNDYISQMDFIDTILAAKHMTLSYVAESLTAEAYCQILRCDDPGLLQYSNDGNFYLSLESIDNDVLNHFNISSKMAVLKLI